MQHFDGLDVARHGLLSFDQLVTRHGLLSFDQLVTHHVTVCCPLTSW